MRRKKIVIAHSWIEVGINNQTRQLAIALSKECDVWFLTQSRIHTKCLQVNDHLTVIEWPNKRPTKFKDLLFCWRLFRQLKPDVVISHFSSIRVSMLGAWLAGVRHRVAWYHTLSGQLKDDVKQYLEQKLVLSRTKFAYQFATNVVALNEAGKKDAISFLGKPAKAVSVVYNGMDLPKGVLNTNWNDTNKAFLFLGRYHASKGGDFIIKISKQVAKKHPGYRLSLVGYGPEEDNWRKLVKGEGLEGIVTVAGKTNSYEEIFEKLAGTYALLVPSRIDNFPTVIIEAKAGSVPAIASNTGGIPEMIQDNVDGFLCKVDDEESWVKKICFLIENPGSRNSMGLAAEESFEKKFSKERHIEAVERFLNSIL